MTYLVLVIIAGLLWITYVYERIPKTGRDGEARGEEITATITNRNKAADRVVTLRATDGRQSFKVKLKPSEARLWIKGDSIRIILSENKKSYRVLFNDYFRENETRLREYALELLEKKVNVNFIAAKLLKYTKEGFENFKASKLESQRIFVFVTLMKMIDVYTIVAAVTGVAFFVWDAKSSPAFNEQIMPLALILLLVWGIYSSIGICRRIMKEVQSI